MTRICPGESERVQTAGPSRSIGHETRNGPSELTPWTTSSHVTGTLARAVRIIADKCGARLAVRVSATSP